MNILFRVLLVGSILLNIVLIYKICTDKRGIAYITSVLAQIRSSGFGSRINTGLSFKSLEKLSTELNILMDEFQKNMEEKQKLELTHKQLISNISHDIRTPLTSLLGFVEVLQKSDDLTGRKQKEYLEIIHSKGDALYKIVQEFFEFSKLEAEDNIIKLDRIDLIQPVKEVLASFYQDFIVNKINPVIDMPEEAVYVWGNEASIQRMLQNLLSNALKYGKDGGTIGICIRQEKDKAWVDIWDKGKGISENDLPFVFNRLFTADTSRNHRNCGSGLGLAITKQLAEKQNGEITVSSIPGEKTVFSFCLIRA